MRKEKHRGAYLVRTLVELALVLIVGPATATQLLGLMPPMLSCALSKGDMAMNGDIGTTKLARPLTAQRL
jgi:hypothetical protein